MPTGINVRYCHSVKYVKGQKLKINLIKREFTKYITKHRGKFVLLLLFIFHKWI